MRNFILLVFAAVLINISSLSSQSGIQLVDADYTGYPNIEIEYFVIENGQNVNDQLNKSDFLLLHNDLNQDIDEIECRQSTDAENVSVLFAIDLSADSSNNNFDSLISFTEYFYNNSTDIEFGLSSFNTVNHLNFDFTQSHSDFLTELQKLKPSTIGYADTLFFSEPIGADKIFENAVEDSEKHIILLTDEYKSINIDYLDQFYQSGINVHLVAYKSDVPKEIKEYYKSNEDLFLFENVGIDNPQTVTSAALLSIVKGAKPCKIMTQVDYSCDTNVTSRLNVPSLSLEAVINREITGSVLPRIELNPKFYGFSSVLPGTSKDADVIITPLNSDITVDSIYFENDYDGVFEIISGDINTTTTLTEGNGHLVGIRYTPKDSAIVFTRLIVESNACNKNEVLITGGFPNTPPNEKKIKVTAPNDCDETLIVGDKYNVEWTGMLPSDVIQLEYSTNDGNSWDTLATNVTGLEYEWEVPDVESDECLVRAIQLWPNNIGRTLDLKHNGEVNSAFFNHSDGSKAVTSSEDGYVRVWNTNTGDEILRMEGHTGKVNYAVFSPDDKFIASCGEDNKVIIWDAETGELIHEFTGHTDNVRSVNFNNDGSRIITASKDGSCKIYGVESGDEVHTFLPDNGSPMNFANYHPNEDQYITGGNFGTLKIWDSETNDKVDEIEINGWIISFAFNQDGTKILVVDQLLKNAVVWDYENKTPMDTLIHTPNSTSRNVILSGSFINLEGKNYIITAGVDKKAVMWNSATGDSVNAFIEHTNAVRTAVFNFDGTRVLTSSWDSTAKIWNLDERDLQMDTSDCNFTITKLNYDKRDLAFGEVVLGNYKDSTLTDAVVNLKNFQFKISDAYLRGENAGDFFVFSELKNKTLDTLKDNNGIDIKVRFEPKNVGIRNAELVLEVPGGEIVINLEGSCSNEDLEVVEKYIDYGEVDLGDFRDRTVEVILRNNSNRNLNFDSIYIDIPRSTDYSIVEGESLTSLSSGEETGAIIRFSPEFIDRSNADLVYQHDGNNSPTRISLLGAGREPVFDTTRITIYDFEANSGNIAKTNIYLTKIDPEILSKGLEGIEFDLTFNKTLLSPHFQFKSDTIVGDDRTIRIALQLDDMMKENLKNNEIQAEEVMVKEIEFMAALGNDSTTTVEISNSSVIGSGKLKIIEEGANFRLLDLCEEGSPRFFDASEKFNLEGPSPNPISANINLNFNLLENGNTSLRLYDPKGKLIKELVNKQLSEGSHSVTLDIEGIPNGAYYLKLSSENQSTVKNIQINR